MERTLNDVIEELIRLWLDQAWTAAQRAGALDSSFAAAVAETVTAIEAARARRQRGGG